MNKLPKVLLLGDSIRMSYQPLVAQKSRDWAEVVGPNENCQFSLYTLSSLARWLGQLGTPDVVHWNNGLHDIGHNPSRRPVQIPLDVYVGNLGFILQHLQGTKAKVIWATSTPVHPRRPFRDDQWSWRNEEIDLYNHAALQLMMSHGVPINDLHAVVAADPDAHLVEDGVHLTEVGRERCAEAATAMIRQALTPAEAPPS